MLSNLLFLRVLQESHTSPYPGPFYYHYSNNLPIVSQNVNIQMYADDPWKASLTPSLLGMAW